MFNIGFSELLLILVVAFVIVGPKDLPKVARAIARWLRQAKQLFRSFQEESGLEETLQDLKDIESGLREDIAGADPTTSLRELRREAEQSIRSDDTQ